MKTTAPTRKTEHELNLYYNQLEALEDNPTTVITDKEKQTLREYYQAQIKVRLKKLSNEIAEAAKTAKQINNYKKSLT